LDSIAPVRQLPSATLGDFVIGVTAAVVTPGDGMLYALPMAKFREDIMEIVRLVIAAAVVLALTGCATMTPEQTAAFVQAMQMTANAVDPYEYAGPRQPPVQPVAEAAPVEAPVAPAQIDNGRPFTPTFPQAQSQPQPAASPEPIGSNIAPTVNCWVDSFNYIHCN